MTNAERCREYYRQNREKRLAKQKEYYEAHRDERLAYAAQYQAEHVDAHNAATRRHRQKDRDANNAYHREYTRKNAERVRETKRQAFARRAEKAAEYNRQRRDPLKTRARWNVANAVRRGTLVKPEECSQCGTATPSRRLHAHHHRGYENALDVLWLCSWCHGAAHRKE